jgi:hypothetical protein
MYHLQAEVFALNLPHRLQPLLAIHLVPMGLLWIAGGFGGFLLYLGFHCSPFSVEFNVAKAG